MKRRSFRFAPRHIWRKAATVVLAAIGATVAFTTSATEVFQDRRPATALAWAPNNAGVNGTVAQRLIAGGQTDQARQFSYAAIRRDPTSVAAFRSLGLAAEAEGNRGQAARLFRIAHRISRRDRPTEAWLIRNAVEAGDYGAAVRHFDIFMRISRTGAEQLVPLLVAATQDPRLLPPLRRQLTRGPVWKTAFLQMLAERGPRPNHTVALSQGLLRPTDDDERVVLRSLILRLTEAGHYNLAWTMYRDARPEAVTPQGAPWLERNFAMHDFPPFDWWLADDPDLAAIRENRPDGQQGQALSLAARNGQRGQVARRVLRLGAGSFTIEYDAGAIPPAPTDRPNLTINCTGVDTPLFTSRPEPGGSPRRFRGTFTIPSSCAWQTIAISISAGEEDSVESPWLANLTIRRTGWMRR